MRQQDLQSSSLNIPCRHGTYCQLFVHPWDLSPIFRVSEVTSINFPYIRGRSINFCQLSVHLRDYPLTFCVSEEHCVIFIKHSVQPWDLPSTSINFSCVCASEFLLTFQRDLLSTFLASEGRSVYLCKLSVHQRDFLSTFRAAAGHSVNFHQFSVHPQYFLSGSVYSLLIRGTMRPLSVRPRDLPSNVRTSTGPSVNFCQHSLSPRDIPSTSVKFP